MTKLVEEVQSTMISTLWLCSGVFLLVCGIGLSGWWGILVTFGGGVCVGVFVKRMENIARRTMLKEIL